MMTAVDILHGLDLPGTTGVPVWVDGGWGMDTLQPWVGRRAELPSESHAAKAP